MKKYLIALVSLFLIVGCQSTNVPGTTLFSPYSNNSNSAASLAQSVQEALMSQGDPVIAQVHVETNQNTVRLSGYVKKIRQSDVAEQITRQVPGVQGVENHIIVRQ